tara:strand:- start:607 stop:1452 length:846 start_codon:yes stop_codon:yes gene_type:complete
MDLNNILPNDGPSIEEVQKYIKKYTDDTIVIKCGGSVLVDENLFKQLIEDLSILNKIGLKIIVVHGGGKNIQKKLNQLNLKSEFINGLRVTDKKLLKVVEKSLIELNLDIIKQLKSKKCKGISLVADSGIITVTKISDSLGYVGKPTEIDISSINKIIKNNEVPVLVPMGMDRNKDKYNINADIAAGAIAKKINSRRLLLMTDVPGILDVNKKLIPEIDTKNAENMIINETITGGMIPKINTCIDVLNNGVIGVVIVDGRKPHSILFELFSDKGAGTLIRK